MGKRPETMSENDAVDLLIEQHQEIRRLFDEVERASDDQRAEAFSRLSRFLAVHETAEEEAVHPIARRSMADGDVVIDARLEEENQSKRTLEALEEMGTSAQAFDALFAELRAEVLAHAEREEQEEFTALRNLNPVQLKGMGIAIKAAEALAPTHPHPGVETATENLMVGPLAAITDRTRDLIRKAIGHKKG